MKRLVVVFLAVGLLAVAQPAPAQTGDPAGLFATGAVIPFLGSAGNISVVELLNPIGPNYVLKAPFPPCPFGPACTDVHLVFFSDACTRNNSLNVPMTTNDSEILSLAFVVKYDGLAVIAGTNDGGRTIVAPAFALQAKMHWFNFDQDAVRVFDPITIRHAENPGLIWNPLRSGADFFAPPEGSTFQTTLYLVCPNVAITGNSAAAPPVPPLITGAPDVPTFTATSNGVTATIAGIAYNDEEKPLRDIHTTCSCLTKRKLADLDLVYTDIAATPFGSYTELFGEPVATPHLFTGWRDIFITDGSLPAGNFDDWSRLPNGSAASIGAAPGVGPGFISATP